MDITYPYTTLGTLGTPVPGVSGVFNGIGVVQLSGWSFPFAGASFGAITVSADGYLAVGNASAVCGCDASMVSLDNSCPDCPGSPPAAGPSTLICPPQQNCFYVLTFEPPFAPGVIAPWWENYGQLQSGTCTNGAPTPSGTISALQGGAPGSRYLIVDYSGVGPYQEGSCTYTGMAPCYDICTDYVVPKNFQVQLFESGAIVFSYGTMDATVVIPGGGEAEDHQCRHHRGLGARRPGRRPGLDRRRDHVRSVRNKRQHGLHGHGLGKLRRLL